MKHGDLFYYKGLLFMVDRVDGEHIYAHNLRHQLVISVGHPELKVV